MAGNKNLTITLGEDDARDLDFLINYYQEQSISTVSKSDVIKFMIRQNKKIIDKRLAEAEANESTSETDNDIPAEN